MLALVAAGCSSSSDGSPATAFYSGVTSGATSGGTSGGVATPTATATSPAVTVLCPSAGDLTALTGCLSTSLSQFWSAQLNTTVTEPVVFHPVAAQVPAPCRPGLTQAPAFTCPGDRKLYFTDAFATKLQTMFPGPLEGYGFAVVLAHEMGHVVQLQVHQPQIERTHPSTASTIFVEQQADCLSGVWAHAAATAIGLNVGVFRDSASTVLTSISTAHEITTHGTPAERLAAIDRGLQGGRPQACRLATFH